MKNTNVLMVFEPTGNEVEMDLDFLPRKGDLFNYGLHDYNVMEVKFIYELNIIRITCFKKTN